MIRTVVLLLCIAVVLSGVLPVGVRAQDGTGIITGTVVDANTGEAMIGATVRVDGTTLGAICDLDGNYRIAGVPVGTHAVTATMIGYQPMRITDIEVEKGEVEKINFAITLEVVDVGEVVVKAQAVRNTEAVLLKDRQKAEAVSDAISSEAISRSGSSDAADAMKQVTGASVSNNEVFVRGLGDRYTSVQMNGSVLPSADPYKRSAPMDLFPSNLLSNIVTVKTFTPDKPGDFSGGTVNVETKAFPDKLTMSYSMSATYNANANLIDDFLTYDGGDSDYLGMDDGTRDVPDILQSKPVIPSLSEAYTDDEKKILLDTYTNSFNNIFAPYESSTPLNQSYAFSIGNQVDVGGRPFGYLGSFTYKNDYSSYNDGLSSRYSLASNVETAEALSRDYDLSHHKSVHNVLWGGLLNLSYKLRPEHELGFNVVVNQNGENSVHFLSGQNKSKLGEEDEGNRVYETRTLQYVERNLQSYQFRGEHFLKRLKNLRIEWSGTYSKAKNDEPDLRYFTNHIVNNVYSIKPSMYPQPARYFRFLDESNSEFKIDFSLPVKVWNGHTGSFKFGNLYMRKDRDFTEYLYEFHNQYQSLRYAGDPEEYFSEENIGIDDEGNIRHYLVDKSQQSGNYSGEQKVNGSYAMLDVLLAAKLRFIGGARYETTDMKIRNEYDPDNDGDLSTDDVLPSANFVYELKPDMNLRAAYGRTLARPTLREMAPYGAFEFVGGFILTGNPDLERTLIDNYDIRWEFFPRPGEIYAFSVYAKKFTNPIETAIINENEEVQYQNVDEARVYGIELELRKGLDQIHEKLEGFSTGGNVSFVRSYVDIADEELLLIRAYDEGADNTREFQGQSPFLLNMNINYDNNTHGIHAGLYYNVFGERLSKIALPGTPNIYEKPRHMLNFSFSKSLTEKISLSLSAKNILDSEVKEIQEFKGVEYISTVYKTGRSYSVGLKYSL